METCRKVNVIHVFANSGWSWQLFSAPVLSIGWIRKTPVIINYRGGEARDYFNKSIKWVRPSINKATDIIVPSGYLKTIFSDFGIESHIIPNIVNLERFQPKGKVWSDERSLSTLDNNAQSGSDIWYINSYKCSSSAEGKQCLIYN